MDNSSPTDGSPAATSAADDQANASAGSRPPLPVRRVRRRRSGAPSRSGAPVGLWFPPLLAEMQLMVGAIALALMFHRIVITGEPTALNGYGFVLLACGFIFLVSKGYSWLQDLYMPRPVIFWGEGGMLVGTLITIAAIVVDHLHERGLGNLIGLAIVLFPLLIFLIRVYMVFSDGRHIPSSRRSRMRVDASTERMAALRRKIRHWMS